MTSPQDLQKLMFSAAIGSPLAIPVMRNGALVDLIAQPPELVAALSSGRGCRRGLVYGPGRTE